MAPEQARGRPADKRVDIWAFGATLLEVFSGKRAFHGEDSTDILAVVVKMEPDYSLLPPDVPVNVRRLIQHCQVEGSAQAAGDGHRFLVFEPVASSAAGPIQVMANWHSALGR